MTPLDTVLADIDGLLALVHNTATKLALALKPLPSYDAVHPIIDKLAQHISALDHCSHLLCDTVHGAALVRHVRLHLTEVVQALQNFLTCVAGVDLDALADEYLVRIGALHNLIDSARGPDGIPKDNRTVVHKFWKEDADTLADNLREIAALVKQAECPLDHTRDEDDGWDDPGFGDSDTRLDEHELARAKNVHSILRLTTLLHSRISRDLLPFSSPAPVSAFDSLLTLSNDLLSTSDELVVACYAPQEPSCLRQEILQIAKIATSLQTQITPMLPVADDLSDQLRALKVNDVGATPSRKRADRKWFDTCVDHILRLCTSLENVE